MDKIRRNRFLSASDKDRNHNVVKCNNTAYHQSPAYINRYLPKHKSDKIVINGVNNARYSDELVVKFQNNFGFQSKMTSQSHDKYETNLFSPKKAHLQTMIHNNTSESNMRYKLAANVNHVKKISPSSLYKTKRCFHYRNTGNCPMGDTCNFAHGLHELRRTFFPAHYRTRKCIDYHAFGLCEYGSQCFYIHEEPNKY